jgi:proteasome accessory factor C
VTTSAAEQLSRILQIIPEIADGEEHDSTTVARKLGIERDTLLADLRAIGERYGLPGGFVEGMEIFIGPTTISARSDQFLRPMGLTVPELKALELGLTVLEQERPPDDRPVIDSARQRLRKLIAHLPIEEYVQELRTAEVVPSDGLPFLDEVRRALKNRRKIRISYRSSAPTDAKDRIIRPYGMAAASGMWYVVAYCEASEGLRVFRADRIEGATPLTDRYEIPANFSIRKTLREGRALQTDTPSGGMTVRYSPRVARWIAEREGREGELSPDGSLTIEHPLADAEWGVRHVLQYGPEAEVLEPQSLREEILRRLSSLGAS